MKKSILISILVVLISAASIAQKQAIAPKIISTIPEFGDCDVDPGLNEIVIKFDQDMQGGRSVIDSRDMPRITEKPYWKDKRTFIIPVNLAADKIYYLIFNNQKYNNFRSADGIPLQPDELIFKTETVDYNKLNSRAYEELFT
ncbi:MAG: hypothetical protein JSV22_05110, partial [Bacteroidales bacterium]